MSKSAKYNIDNTNMTPPTYSSEVDPETKERARKYIAKHCLSDEDCTLILDMLDLREELS